jgi:hypothetical protein
MKGRKALYRLEIELSNKILKADIEKLKKIILFACNYAITESRLNDSYINIIIEKYKNGYLDIDDKQKVCELEEKFDNEYFDLLEAEEDDNCEKGGHMIPFRKARALSAVKFCFESDIFISTIEAVYEASMVSDDNSSFLQEIKSILDT